MSSGVDLNNDNLNNTGLFNDVKEKFFQTPNSNGLIADFGGTNDQQYNFSSFNEVGLNDFEVALEKDLEKCLVDIKWDSSLLCDFSIDDLSSEEFCFDSPGSPLPVSIIPNQVYSPSIPPHMQLAPSNERTHLTHLPPPTHPSLASCKVSKEQDIKPPVTSKPSSMMSFPDFALQIMASYNFSSSDLENLCNAFVPRSFPGAASDTLCVPEASLGSENYSSESSGAIIAPLPMDALASIQTAATPVAAADPSTVAIFGNATVKLEETVLNDDPSTSSHEETSSDLDFPEESTESTSTASKKQRVKRPMNSFLLFSNHMRHVLQSKFPDKPNAEISKLLGNQWKSMSSEEKKDYVTRALQIKADFSVANPDYVYTKTPRKKRKLKKKDEQPDVSISQNWASTFNPFAPMMLSPPPGKAPIFPHPLGPVRWMLMPVPVPNSNHFGTSFTSPAMLPRKPLSVNFTPLKSLRTC